MSQEEIFINGELLRLRREARGWVINDMATRACMSVKQIRQLEEGGMSAFYSLAVKATAAKKVGTLLGLSADEVFAPEVDPAAAQEPISPEILIEASESLPAESSTAVPESKQSETPATKQAAVSTSVEDAPNSKNSFWSIAVLLAIALAVAAYLQPKDEPAAEPAPPLQVLPVDVVDPASAASAAEMPASDTVGPASASAPAQKSASAISSVLSAATPVASAPRLLAPAASSAAIAVNRTASTTVASPPASTASKTP
jgi:transcriptional regulator with XRE-family HTH domain